MKTRDKIIFESLKLFNENGERQVTTNHIAAHLGLSPGTLYYHFRNKEDIIQSIFEKYISHMRESFLPAEDNVPAEVFLQKYCDEVFSSIWTFRFFHSSMPGIVLRDKELHAQYLSAHNVMGERAKQSVINLKRDNIIQIDDEEIDDLIELMRVVGSFWMSYLMANANDEIITKASIYRGVVKIMTLLWPYTTPVGRTRLLVLRNKYEKLASEQ